MNRIEIAGLAGLGVYLLYTFRNQQAPQTVVTTGTQVRPTSQTMPWQNIPVQYDQQGSQIYGNVGNSPADVTQGSDTSNPSAGILYNDPVGAPLQNHPIVQPTTQPPPATSKWTPPAWIKGDQSVREVIEAYKAFGVNSAVARYLRTAPKNGLVNGSLNDTINAYEAGGIYAWDTYNNAHASPRDFGWTWTGKTWQGPIGGNTDKWGNKWNGVNFV
jgi:hypothetical protein